MSASRPRPVTWRLAPFALAALLAGCASLAGPSDVPSIYDLDAASVATVKAPRRAAQILVPVPTANDALSGSRVVVREAGGSLAFLSGVTWSDELPSLLQSTLARSLENSGRVKAVGKPGQSLAIDDQLIVDIRAFELDVAGAPEAHVSLGVKLLDDRNGRIRAARVFDVRVAAKSDRPGDALAALKAATAEAMADIVAWTATSL